jgi:energy-coupling factor transporter ATP-binding protein EcfA2
MSETKQDEPIIEVQDLWHVYGGTIEALRGVSVTVYPGESVAIVGQNGSGKTTLVKHFNGLLRPTQGKVLIDGEDASQLPVYALSRRIGYVFQNPDDMIFNSTVEEEIMFGLNLQRIDETEAKQRTEKVLADLGLIELRQTHPFSLSLGDRQRVALAAILAVQPDVIVFDEPTTGQDYRGSKQIMEIIKTLNQNGITVISITHDMKLVAEYTKRVIVMSEGLILNDGPPSEVFSDKEVLSKAGLQPPQISELARMLAQYGIRPDILTVEDMAACMEQVIKGGMQRG